MAWWDSQHHSLGASPGSTPRLTLGDAFPRLEPPHISKHAEMERERPLSFLSPVVEEHPGPPTTPALMVHVDVHFTDPVIRSRYCRSYGSSPSFDASDRICRGIVRRIERCSEEFITRKDSGALEVFKGNTYERKPQRFEMTFRITRRGKGEWAERTYRSYQKHPLTVALTKEVTLAVHGMIGLFLRRHDANFKWLDCPAPEDDSEGGETTVPSHHGPLSLLSIPRSRFIEATQTFAFVPGYSIDLCFRNKNLQRQTPGLERRITVDSAQTTPLTRSLSEELLRKALQFISRGLESKEQELDDGHGAHSVCGCAHLCEDDVVEIDLSVSNNLGPRYGHTHQNIKGRLALLRGLEAGDCGSFLADAEKFLVHARNEVDTTLSSVNELDLRIVELKGVGWTVREAATFTLDPSVSYGRRTVQAALDRIQTGIGEVIRGHNVSIHIKAHKRGHPVLDKAIVAHEKHGKPKEAFASRQDAQMAFVARLKVCIQQDIDKAFEDSCSIDDIPDDDEEGHLARPITPMTPAQSEQLEQPSFEGLLSRPSPSSTRSFSENQSRPASGSFPGLNLQRSRSQRVFSLSRRSTDSMSSIDYLKAARDPYANDSSRPSTATSEQILEPRGSESPVPSFGGLLAAAEVLPRRSFSLMSRRPSSITRISDASTLFEERTVIDASRKAVDRDLKVAEDEDELSTAPSTPGLSTGASSPRHSVSLTPVYQRTTSSCAKHAAPRDLYEPEDRTIDQTGKGATTQHPGSDRLATDVSTEVSTQPVPAPNTRPINLPVDDTNNHPTPEIPDPAARVRAVPPPPPQPPNSTTTPLPTSQTPPLPSRTPSTTHSNPNIYIHPAPPLGTEPPEAQSHRGPLPDFPTSQVRTSSGPASDAPHDDARRGVNLGARLGDGGGAETSETAGLEPEVDIVRLGGGGGQPGGEAGLGPEGGAGGDYGAGAGAEEGVGSGVEIARATARGGGRAAGEPRVEAAGAESVAGEGDGSGADIKDGLESEVEIKEEIAQPLVDADQPAGETGVEPESVAGEDHGSGPGTEADVEPEADIAHRTTNADQLGGETGVGLEGIADEEYGSGPGTEADVASETDIARQTVDDDRLDVEPERVADEAHGAGPRTEADVAPEVDIAHQPADADQTTSRSSLELEAHSSAPSPGLGFAEHPTADPEHQAHGDVPVPTGPRTEQHPDLQAGDGAVVQPSDPGADSKPVEQSATEPLDNPVPAPTDTGPEQDANLPTGEGGDADSSEISVEHGGSGEDVGTVGLDILPEAPTIASGAAQEEITVPVVAGAAEESPELDDGLGAEEESIQPPAVGVAASLGTEDANESGPGRFHIVSTIADSADNERPENDAIKGTRHLDPGVDAPDTEIKEPDFSEDKRQEEASAVLASTDHARPEILEHHASEATGHQSTAAVDAPNRIAHQEETQRVVPSDAVEDGACDEPATRVEHVVKVVAASEMEALEPIGTEPRTDESFPASSMAGAAEHKFPQQHELSTTLAVTAATSKEEPTAELGNGPEATSTTVPVVAPAGATERWKPDSHGEANDSGSVSTVAEVACGDMCKPVIGRGQGDESITGPTLAGAAETEFPKLDVGDRAQDGWSVPVIREVAGIKPSTPDIDQGVKQESGLILAVARPAEVATPARDVNAAEQAADSSGVLNGVGVDGVAAAGINGGARDDGEVAVHDTVKRLFTTKNEVPEPESGEKQSVQADIVSQRFGEETIENKEKSPEPHLVHGSLRQGPNRQTDDIGEPEAYESDQGANPHAGSVAGKKQAEFPRTTFGPEARIPTDELTEADDPDVSGKPDDIQQHVCDEPRAGSAKPQSSSRHTIAPTPISLTTPVSDTRNQLATSQHTFTPASKLLRTSTSTIGLGLGLGLRGSRFAPIGLRAALGDVQARRLGLSPQQQQQQQQQLPPDQEEATEELSGTQSEAGSLTGLREDGGGGGDDVDDGRSALPRMMMLLAGAVAVGTIMQRVGE